MSSRSTHQATILLFTLSFLTSVMPTSQRRPSFITNSCLETPLRHDVSFRSRVPSLILFVKSPIRPIEEEREYNFKEEKDRNDREWKQVIGGFVPNFLKRSQSQYNGDQSELDVSCPFVQTIDNLPDYKRIVVEERNQLVVVRYFASWCKSCKAAQPLFKKIVSQYSNLIKFVEVPLTKETAFIHEGLGVLSVPFAHIYHPEVGLVEEMKISKKTFREFQCVLENYIRGSCELPLDEEECDAHIGSFQ